ncbi:hypothetical protein [Streptomyces sp. URMC 123]
MPLLEMQDTQGGFEGSDVTDPFAEVESFFDADDEAPIVVAHHHS